MDNLDNIRNVQSSQNDLRIKIFSIRSVIVKNEFGKSWELGIFEKKSGRIKIAYSIMTKKSLRAKMSANDPESRFFPYSNLNSKYCSNPFQECY